MQEYSAQDEHEKRMIALRGHRNGVMPWENKSAQISDFCGVIDAAGNVIYQYPREKFPARVYYPLGIVAGGSKAAVLVGSVSKATSPDEDAEDDRAISYTEVWIWEAPQTLKKSKLAAEDLHGNALLEKLRNGKL